MRSRFSHVVGLSLFSVLFMMSFARALAQGYDTPIFQANPLCPISITLTAGHDPIEYRLRFDQTIVSQGLLGSGETAEMELSVSDQWYVLLIEWNGVGDYTLSSRLHCRSDDRAGSGDGTGSDAGGGIDVLPTVEPTRDPFPPQTDLLSDSVCSIQLTITRLDESSAAAVELSQNDVSVEGDNGTFTLAPGVRSYRLTVEGTYHLDAVKLCD